MKGRSRSLGGIGGSLVFLSVLPVLIPLGVPFSGILVPIVTNSLIGAGFASGSVALARQGDARPLKSGENPALMLDGD